MKARTLASNLALILGIAGATLLSFDFELRNIGYFPFLLSAALSCILLWKVNNQLFTLNVIFAIINLNGIVQFFILAG